MWSLYCGCKYDVAIVREVCLHQGDGDAVRYYDDMDVSDRHLHTLHQSIRDLNSGHQRLQQELEQERLRRTRFVHTLSSRNSPFHIC